MGEENQNPVEIPPVVKIHVLPGGKMPERQTTGSIGYDVYGRAIVSPSEKDPVNPTLRLTLFDFVNLPTDPAIAPHAIEREDGGFNYRLEPGESVLVGIGFVTEMPFPMFYWVAPRSGLASRYGITVTNAPGTVDPDYRGEAGVLVYNRNTTHFDLEPQTRIAQIIFQEALIPCLRLVESYTDLTSTARGTGGFGSTGLK